MVVDSELEVLKGLLKKTFSNIKTDISVNSKEIERLHSYNRKLEMQLMQLTNEIKDLKREITNKISVEKSSLEVAQKLADIEKKLDQAKAPEKGLTAQIMRRVSRNKKRIVKKKIVDIATTQELALAELKEIVVDEQALCSKATFYRYFEDLKKKGVLSTISVDDINMVVVPEAETSIRKD